MANRAAPAVHAAEPGGVAAPYTSVAPALYRAALGAVNPDHYLAAFERLDAVGRVLPGWNLAAALFTLGWLVFRRLWSPALWVAVGMLLAAAVLWGVSWWLAVPLPMLAGVALAVWLTLCAGMGLYGDALLHADVHRRMTAAVSAAPNMREAVALLQRQAASWRRLWWLVASAAAGLVLVVVAAWWTFAGRVTAQPVQDAVAVTVVATARPESVPQPSQPALPSAAVMESLPDPAGEPGIAEPDPWPAAVVRTPAARPPSAQAVPESAPVAAAPQATSEPRAQAVAPVEERAPASRAQRRLYVNVGLFADAENARRAYLRLRQAGLSATIDPLVRADGSRLQRVRVGPFTSAAQANQAAARVRALGLDAVAAAQ